MAAQVLEKPIFSDNLTTTPVTHHLAPSQREVQNINREIQEYTNNPGVSEFSELLASQVDFRIHLTRLHLPALMANSSIREKVFLEELSHSPTMSQLCGQFPVDFIIDQLLPLLEQDKVVFKL